MGAEMLGGAVYDQLVSGGDRRFGIGSHPSRLFAFPLKMNLQARAFLVRADGQTF